MGTVVEGGAAELLSQCRDTPTLLKLLHSPLEALLSNSGALPCVISTAACVCACVCVTTVLVRAQHTLTMFSNVTHTLDPCDVLDTCWDMKISGCCL